MIQVKTTFNKLTNSITMTTTEHEHEHEHTPITIDPRPVRTDLSLSWCSYVLVYCLYLIAVIVISFVLMLWILLALSSLINITKAVGLT